LYKKRADEDGKITDESGNNLDAQLTDSNCGNFDNARAIFDTPIDIQIGDAIELLINLYDVSGTQYFVGNVLGNGGIRYNGSDLLVYSGSSVNLVTYAAVDKLVKLEVVRTSFSDYDIYIDDVFIGTSGDGDLEIKELGSRDGSYFFDGCIAKFKTQNVEINFSEGGLSDTSYSILGNNNADISAVLSTFWNSSQDMHHYNYQNGFDLWENGTAGEEIRVPIGTIVAQAGYSFTDSYPAVTGLNNCESEIDFSVSLAFAYDPLAYDEFQTDFDGNHQVFSCLKDKNHSNVRFYDAPLSVANTNKVLKCLSKKSCVTLVTDSSGALLVDTDGYYIIL